MAQKVKFQLKTIRQHKTLNINSLALIFKPPLLHRISKVISFLIKKGQIILPQ